MWNGKEQQKRFEFNNRTIKVINITKLVQEPVTKIRKEDIFPVWPLWLVSKIYKILNLKQSLRAIAEHLPISLFTSFAAFADQAPVTM